jgi:hypothetical protein
LNDPNPQVRDNATGLRNTPQGGFHWKQLIRMVFDANPGIDPAVAASAVANLVHTMQPVAKAEFLEAHNQFLQQQLAMRDATARYGIDTRAQTAAEGQASATNRTGMTQAGALTRNPTAQAFQKFLEEHPDATAEEQAAFINSLKPPRGGAGASKSGLSSVEEDALVDRIGTYQMAPYSGIRGAGIMGKVAEKYPSYDAKEWGKRVAGEKGFGVGRQGDTVRAIGTAYRHMETLGELGEDLENTGAVPLNKFFQYVSEISGQAPPTNFDGAKQIVVAEVVKAVIATGGGVKERQAAEERVSRASSPEQLIGIINDVYKPLLEGQLEGYREQYKNATGKDDFDEKFAPKSKPHRKAGKPREGAAGGPETRTIEGKTYIKQGGQWFEQ